MEVADAHDYLATIRASIVGVASQDYPTEVIEGWAPSISDDAIRLVLENPEGEIRLVGEIEETILGIGALVLQLNELRACYVSPAGIRRGVGTAIVRELERIAANHGITHLELHATITAEPFYRHLGYQSVEKIRHVTSTGVTMDAIRMSKRL